MWGRDRKAKKNGLLGPFETTPAWRCLLAALNELSGTARGVVYDVPFSMRPRSLDRHGIFLEGSLVWERFLRTRRELDDGQLTVILSLRTLADEERWMVVDWGTTYANSFLLVEPNEPSCDLSDSDNPVLREALKMAGEIDRPTDRRDSQRERWTSETELGGLLRDLFGTWVYWRGPLPDGEPECVPLTLRAPSDTLANHLLFELNARFPQAAFDAAVADLNAHERELLGGPVPRGRSAFRTRLGLPILHDPQAADRAIRRLVNLGKMRVVSRLPSTQTFGPGSPVPEDMPDDEFERLDMA